jgi:hypothetical protein
VEPKEQVLGDLRYAPRREIMKVNITIGIPDWLDRICAWPMMLYRRRKFGYDFRRIYLGDDKWTIVEPADFYRINNFGWFIVGKKTRLYAARNIINETGKIKIVRLHREIMKAPAKLLVDHRNGNSLDNRRDNLRLATLSQNACNVRINKAGCSSRYRGVRWSKVGKRWEAQLGFKRKSIFLGHFDSEEEAARVYDEAAKKYHGEFARLNFSESADSVQRAVNSPSTCSPLRPE